MYINNNLSALDAWRNLVNTQNNLNTAITELSSGLRINSAANDPAGYSISQQMQSQINGYDQAQRNAQDGISLIQTANGALNQTLAILQNMRQLSVESSSDTSTAQDRADLQQQMDQFAVELTQIANTTQFNTKEILSGAYSNGATGSTISLQVGANPNQTISFNLSAADASNLGVSRNVLTAVSTASTFVSSVSTDGPSGINSIDLTASSYNVVATSVGGGSYTLQLETSTGTDIGTAVTVSGTTAQTAVVGDAATGQALDVTLTAASLSGASVTIGVNTTIETSATATTSNGRVVTSAVAYGGISIGNAADAQKATTALDNAINQISSEQANLGAVQDRLQYTNAALGAASDNITAAQSAITGVDMAKEMTKFTREQILMQSGTDMLFQANQIPQSILNLLK